MFESSSYDISASQSWSTCQDPEHSVILDSVGLSPSNVHLRDENKPTHVSPANARSLRGGTVRALRCHGHPPQSPRQKWCIACSHACSSNHFPHSALCPKFSSSLSNSCCSTRSFDIRLISVVYHKCLKSGLIACGYI